MVAKQRYRFDQISKSFCFSPFGFGTRMCLSQRISKLELHLLMARIVQQFDISYSLEAENVELFIRGVTICDRPHRQKYWTRWRPRLRISSKMASK